MNPPPVTATGSAPTRVCLSGENLDWIGGRSVCVAVDLPTTVTISEGLPCLGHPPGPSTPEVIDAVWGFLRRVYGDLPVRMPAVRVESRAPVGGGLASSSALIIAALRAFLAHTARAEEVSVDTLARWAYEIEFQVCRGGGMDQVSILFGGATLTAGTTVGLPSVSGHVQFPPDWSVLIIDSGVAKSTRDQIRIVRQRQRDGDAGLTRYVEIADDTSGLVWSGLRAAALPPVWQGMDLAHRAMRDLQDMSSPVLETLRQAAWRRSGLPFKVTGAGAGGSLVAVCARVDAAGHANRISQDIARVAPAARLLTVNAAPRTASAVTAGG